MKIYDRHTGKLILKVKGKSLKNKDLSNMDLTNANLSNMDLSGVNLRNSKLAGVNFLCSDLSNANLTNTDLSNANLTNTNLRKINLSVSNMRNANLANANLVNAIVIDADLTNSILLFVDFSNSILCKTSIIGADVRNSIYENTDLFDVTFMSSKNYYGFIAYDTTKTMVHCFNHINGWMICADSFWGTLEEYKYKVLSSHKSEVCLANIDILNKLKVKIS